MPSRPGSGAVTRNEENQQKTKDCHYCPFVGLTYPLLTALWNSEQYPWLKASAPIPPQSGRRKAWAPSIKNFQINMQRVLPFSRKTPSNEGRCFGAASPLSSEKVPRASLWDKHARPHKLPESPQTPPPACTILTPNSDEDPYPLGGIPLPWPF